LENTVALGLYQDPLREVIHKFKYKNGKRLAPLLAALLALAIKNSSVKDAWELVTYVPMHPHRERERGYNQSRLLAEELALHLSLECHPLLIRTRKTQPQMKLNWEERTANLKGCMKIMPGAKCPSSLLLVDDVFTTGSTLSECARVLSRNGVKTITAAVLARDLLS
jgi:ComF family protein